jgi:hypothetical protein
MRESEDTLGVHKNQAAFLGHGTFRRIRPSRLGKTLAAALGKTLAAALGKTLAAALGEEKILHGTTS